MISAFLMRSAFEEFSAALGWNRM